MTCATAAEHVVGSAARPRYPDPVKSFEALWSELSELARTRPSLTTVHVSHHVEELPASLTHALLLRDGAVVASGHAEAALTSETLSACFAAPVRVVAAGGRRLAVIRSE